MSSSKTTQPTHRLATLGAAIARFNRPQDPTRAARTFAAQQELRRSLRGSAMLHPTAIRVAG